MKKKNIIVWTTVGMIAVGTFWWYDKMQTRSPEPKRNQKSLTTKEILEARADNKRERQAAGVQKFDNPNSYNYYHLGIRRREGETMPGYGVNYHAKELQKARRNLPKNLRTTALNFVERGPANTPGRARSVLVLPNDPSLNTWLVGSVGGGIWKTTDGGASWANVTPEAPSLAITSMEYSATNPNIIYAGTGEVIGGSVGIIGSGVYKSTDGGSSWEPLASTSNAKEFSYVNRVVVHPDDPDIVLICSSEGPWEENFRSSIFKSTDGGGSWNEVYESDSWVSQLIFNPENPNTIIGALWQQGTVKSTDGGETWEKKTQGFYSITGRVELAVAPTDSSWVYASVVGNAKGANFDLYLSTDAGESWKLVDQRYNNAVRIDLLGGQGDYDNTIAVSPYDKRVVYFGGVSLWKVTVGETLTEEFVKSMEVDIVNGNASIWSLINFGAGFDEGKLELGTRIGIDDFNTVYVITGPGIGQKAHRFTVDKKGPGVPDSDYQYEDYVDVPFQVWDLDNNVQLMISFRDQQEDGEFNLVYENTSAGDDENHSREYLFIHDVDYAETASSDIAQNGGTNRGHTYRQMYFFWPVLSDGLEFDGENLETDSIKLIFSKDTLRLQSGSLANISDAYNNYGGKNPAYNAEGDGFTLHPDHHALLLLPDNEASQTFRILNCNDGGIYYSNSSGNPGFNDGDWTFSGFGMNSSQFYSADKKTGAEVFIGGMQDNGTWISPDSATAGRETNYAIALGGDGFEAIWHNVNTDMIIGSSQFNNFAKTTNGGNTWFVATSGLSGTSPFISKLANSPSDPNTLFTVTSAGVFKSVEFGDNWTLTPINENWGFSSFLDVEVSRANAQIIWAGSGMGSSQQVHVSTDGGASFVPTPNYDQAVLGNLSGMATHPYDDSTAYILFSFAEGPKILRTTDLGQTWEDISGFGAGTSSTNGFPDVAVYSLLVRPDEPSTLWAGTEIGIFESTDNGDSWTFLESDLGTAAVWQMKVVDDMVVIATHGRGIWTAQLDEAVEVTIVPELQGGGTAISGGLYLKASLYSPYDSTLILASEVVVGKIGSSTIALDTVVILDAPSLTLDQVHPLKLVSYRNGKAYSSQEKEALYFQIGETLTEYINDFDDADNSDFIGNGFSLEQPEGFGDAAIHSQHPYPEGMGNPGNELNFHYYLRHPVTVNKGLSKIKYRDIALVEPGESQSFGAENFFDYVVVEASNDGVEWTAIADGYDARKNPAWLTAFNNEEPGTAPLFRNQEISILDRFQAGETIMIRFRLFSDPFAAGWGWVIDDLRIQDEVLVSTNRGSIFEIHTYPNPAVHSAMLRVTSPGNQQVRVRLIDFQGREVRKYGSSALQKGINEIRIERGDLKSGVYFVKVYAAGGEYVEKLIFLTE